MKPKKQNWLLRLEKALKTATLVDGRSLFGSFQNLATAEIISILAIKAM